MKNWRFISPNLQIELIAPICKDKNFMVFSGKYRQMNGSFIDVAVRELQKIVKDTKIEYFENEIRSYQNQATVNHPNLIKVYDIIQINGFVIQNQLQVTAYIVMELFVSNMYSFISLQQIDLARSLSIILNVTKGVEEFHNKNMIHLGVTSKNVYISPIPGDNQYKLGNSFKMETIKMFVDEEKIEYLAPEIINYNSCSQSADIWALGVLLHKLITKVSLFDGEDQRQAEQDILSFQSYYFKWRKAREKFSQKERLTESFLAVEREDVAQLLEGMLNPNPAQRFDIKKTIGQIRQIESLMKNQLAVPDFKQQLPPELIALQEKSNQLINQIDEKKKNIETITKQSEEYKAKTKKNYELLNKIEDEMEKRNIKEQDEKQEKIWSMFTSVSFK